LLISQSSPSIYFDFKFLSRPKLSPVACTIKIFC
jgi:hypothetical protein